MGYKIFNQKEWIPYLKSNDNFKLYKNGLLKSKQLQTDNFLKQLRFLVLLRLLKMYLKIKRLRMKTSLNVDVGEDIQHL